MRVTSRLSLGSSLVLLLLLGAMGYQVHQILFLAGAGRSIAHSGLGAGELSLEEAHDLDEMERAARKYLVTGDRDYLEKARSLVREAGKRQKRLEGLALTPKTREAAARLGDALRDLGEALDSSEFKGGEEGLLRMTGEAERLAASVFEEAGRSVEERAGALGLAAERAVALSILVALIALAAGLAVFWLTLRSIRVPLAKLARATGAVAEGRFDHTIPLSGDDEFTRLSGDFNEMVRRLEEADREKRDLLSHVSHDLKTPLAAMEESIRLLLEEIPGPLTADQRRLLALDLKSARRLSAMIGKTLDTARLEAGVIAFDLKEADLRPLLAECAERAISGGGEGGGWVDWSPPEETLQARFDRDRFAQVMDNLLENAAKYSPPGTPVLLRAEMSEGLPPDAPKAVRALLPEKGIPYVIVSVADRGPGIPEDQKRRIFERFQRGARSTGPAAEGVGLGLAICSEIVRAHGGFLWVSDNPGGGSVFSVALPSPPIEGGGEEKGRLNQ